MLNDNLYLKVLDMFDCEDIDRIDNNNSYVFDEILLFID